MILNRYTQRLHGGLHRIPNDRSGWKLTNFYSFLTSSWFTRIQPQHHIAIWNLKTIRENSRRQGKFETKHLSLGVGWEAVDTHSLCSLIRHLIRVRKCSTHHSTNLIIVIYIMQRNESETTIPWSIRLTDWLANWLTEFKGWKSFEIKVWTFARCYRSFILMLRWEVLRRWLFLEHSMKKNREDNSCMECACENEKKTRPE